MLDKQIYALIRSAIAERPNDMAVLIPLPLDSVGLVTILSKIRGFLAAEFPDWSPYCYWIGGDDYMKLSLEVHKE